MGMGGTMTGALTCDELSTDLFESGVVLPFAGAKGLLADQGTGLPIG